MSFIPLHQNRTRKKNMARTRVVVSGKKIKKQRGLRRYPLINKRVACKPFPPTPPPSPTNTMEKPKPVFFIFTTQEQEEFCIKLEYPDGQPANKASLFDNISSLVGNDNWEQALTKKEILVTKIMRLSCAWEEMAAYCKTGNTDDSDVFQRVVCKILRLAATNAQTVETMDKCQPIVNLLE